MAKKLKGRVTEQELTKAGIVAVQPWHTNKEYYFVHDPLQFEREYLANLAKRGNKPLSEAKPDANLRGRALDEALNQWVEQKYDAKLGATDDLPDRDTLLGEARAEVSRAVKDQQIRDLRTRYASPSARRGGAPTHKRNRRKLSN